MGRVKNHYLHWDDDEQVTMFEKIRTKDKLFIKPKTLRMKPPLPEEVSITTEVFNKDGTQLD